VHLGSNLVNNQLDAKFSFLISVVLIRHLVYVTVCRWLFGVQVWMEPAHQTVTYIQWHIPDVVLIQLVLLMF